MTSSPKMHSFIKMIGNGHMPFINLKWKNLGVSAVHMTLSINVYCMHLFKRSNVDLSWSVLLCERGDWQ